MDYVTRRTLYSLVEQSLLDNPITAILGPRQCGKTTLARLFTSDLANRFDLESPLTIARLQPNAYGVLSNARGVVILDEAQVWPELFSILRVVVDEPGCLARFILTGSASPLLTEKISQSLAGRVHFIEMSGFNTSEIDPAQCEALWFRGGFPRSFLADDDGASLEWREDFLKTYLMRDVQDLAGSRLPPVTVSRLLSVCAHYHGQTWNRDQIANTLSVDTKTIERYLDVLEGAFLARRLPSYETNLPKRVRRAPRFYFRDSGLLHSLLQIRTKSELCVHDRAGASWEGFCIEQIAQQIERPQILGYWRTQAGVEVDLVGIHRGKTLGFEFKTSLAPSVRKGSYQAIKDLGLARMFVVYPGSIRQDLGNGIELCPLTSIGDILL